jgi:hypothetical protein
MYSRYMYSRYKTILFEYIPVLFVYVYMYKYRICLRYRSVLTLSSPFTHPHIHTYIHSYIYTFTHTYIHTYIHSHIHTFTHSHIHPFTHSYTHTYIHTFTHTYIHTYIHSYIHTYIHTYIHLRLLKLEILTSLSYKDNIHSILREFQTYVKDSNEEFVCTTVRAIGRISDSDPSVSSACMEGIMHLLLCSKSDVKLSACVVTLRQMLQQNSKSPTSFKILRQLVKLLIENGVTEPVARSSIVWLTGEFQESLAEAGPDALRILASGFADESTEAKVQIMNLAIKQSLHFPINDGIQQLMTYVLEMSRYDCDCDLRDRARFMTAMMGLAPSNETETGILIY